jgi:hypothetical protein
VALGGVTLEALYPIVHTTLSEGKYPVGRQESLSSRVFQRAESFIDWNPERTLGPDSSASERAPVKCGRDLAGRLERTLHPRAHVGHVIAGEIDAPVRLA